MGIVSTCSKVKDSRYEKELLRRSQKWIYRNEDTFS